jgi:hypothetical protein
VNEYYPLNPDDPKSETVPLVYTVPMRSTMPSLRAATDAVKIVNINSWRPLTNKVSIHINGTSATDTIRIDGNAKNTWYKVQTADNREAWIKASAIEEI